MRRFFQLLISILTERPRLACCAAGIHWANFR
jgi:hypothetical protein